MDSKRSRAPDYEEQEDIIIITATVTIHLFYLARHRVTCD